MFVRFFLFHEYSPLLYIFAAIKFSIFLLYWVSWEKSTTLLNIVYFPGFIFVNSAPVFGHKNTGKSLSVDFPVLCFPFRSTRKTSARRHTPLPRSRWDRIWTCDLCVPKKNRTHFLGVENFQKMPKNPLFSRLFQSHTTNFFNTKFLI